MQLSKHIGPVSTAPGYAEIKAALDAASFHYADDTTAEWDKAKSEVNRAVLLLRQHRWRYDMIDRLFYLHSFLVERSAVINQLFTAYYALGQANPNGEQL